MLEFALTGVPLIFIWISIVQISLGMWHYHTLQYAVKAAGAFTSHRGKSYIAAGNSAIRIQDAANVLAQTAIGMPASSISVTWTSGATTVTCQLNNCQTNTTIWPATASNAIGSEFTIKANYVFNSAIAMVAPGATGGAVRFGSHDMPAYTRQLVLF
jgi:Flp pilus assembly protein TadG